LKKGGDVNEEQHAQQTVKKTAQPRRPGLPLCLGGEGGELNRAQRTARKFCTD